MAFPVRLTEEAEKDLIDAATWFVDEMNVDLANRFIDCMESTVLKWADSPKKRRGFKKLCRHIAPVQTGIFIEHLVNF